MQFGRNARTSNVLMISLISVTLAALLIPVSAPRSTIMAKPAPPGTYEIDIPGDASGLHMICIMFEQFSASKLKWSTSVPSYPPGTYFNVALDARSLDSSKLSDTTYHLSMDGLEEFSISASGAEFYVKCRSGELDLVFSDPYYSYYYWTYRKVDINGALKGDVVFTINIPPLPSFHYEGPELNIDVYIGM